MLNGLDLFSGIGGIAIALSEWVRPMAYCEIDPYCQAILLNRSLQGKLPYAPIWDDVRTLRLPSWTIKPDIISGGFPCQDISVAGHGKGLAGERSGLFFEIVRLAQEIKPKFIFLENVPAITSRGGVEVVRQIAEMGYDCRWCVVSAASIGALHRRERWFLLGYSKHNGSSSLEEPGSIKTSIHTCQKGEAEAGKPTGTSSSSMLASEPLADSRHQCTWCLQEPGKADRASFHDTRCSRFWETEPDVGRVADGIPQRIHRIRALGNAVVPQQAKEAFKILMGLK